MNRNLVVRPKRGYALPGPTVAVAGGELVAVKNAGNQVVRGDPDQKANRGDDVLRCAVAPPAPTPRQAQFGMNPTSSNANASQYSSPGSKGTDWRRLKSEPNQ